MSKPTDGVEALHRLKSTDPPLYLSPSSELSQAARSAASYIFSSLAPHTPKSPFERLLTQGFDHEQIFQQIDLQLQPLISSLRREVKKFEKNPEEISKLFGGVEKKNDGLEIKGEVNGVDDEELEEFDDDEEDDEEEDGDEERESEEEREYDEKEEEEEGGSGGGGVEDRFLKIKELEEYLDDDEAREYGLKKKKSDSKVAKEDEDEKGEDGDDDDDEEEEDVEVRILVD